MFVQILLGRKLARFEGAFTDWQIADYGPVINTVVRDMGGLDAIGLQMVRDEWKYQREVQSVVSSLSAAGERPNLGQCANIRLTGDDLHDAYIDERSP